MTQDQNILAGREIVRAAYEANLCGIDAVVYVEGIAPIIVREIKSMRDDAATATVLCWRGDSPAEMWVVALAAVRGVEIMNDMNADRLES